MALGLKYLRAVEQAGGVPLVAPPLTDHALEAMLDDVSGVCLSGGPDLDPVAYGAHRHELAGPSWEALDRFELALARAADARHLPVLAICRGLQVLNVARGGTLHQHLPDVVGDGISHRQSEPGAQPTHSITVSGTTRLGAILRSERRMVNSFHHQAVATLGEGLQTAAWAGDGTVEAVEAVDRDFVLGVQWHAECLTDQAADAALFDAFIEAARQFGQERSRVGLAA
jgi:putative glutamine amidotransferase